MESRLGVRAADAKTLPHYHYMDLSNRITRIHPTTARNVFLLASSVEVEGRRTDAILIIGQGLHRTGVCVH